MSLQDFVLLSKLGQGAYSSVLKVKRISDGNIYALKKVKISNLKEKQKQNALNQVRLLASVSNQNIIAYKEAFFDQKTNTLCIVLQYAEEGDLQKLIEKRKKTISFISQQQIWKMIKNVTSGLSLLHQMKTIHRDLKCANIFISNGVYKLGDLNVSKLLKKNLAYTQTGTPYYASPQVWKDQPYQLKSDIWSLGCIIYEMCALKPPFTSNSLEGLFKKVSKGVYPRIPACYSQALQNLIAKCINLDPKKRPTCKQLLQMIPQQNSLINQNPQQIKKIDEGVINLLSTIKVPRDLQSWREDLPKPNYENRKSSIDTSSKQSKFGYISQQRLRQIVRSKNENIIIKNYNSKSNLTPQLVYPSAIVQNHYQNQKSIDKQQNYRELSQNNQDIPLNYHNKIEKKYDLLPKIKMHSQPSQKIIEPIIVKQNNGILQQRRRDYNYNRPVWWG